MICLRGRCGWFSSSTFLFALGYIIFFILGVVVAKYIGNILKSGRTMHSVAFITCPDIKVAESLSELLVTKRLAACVNIVPGVKSVYMWQGNIEKSNELLLIVKTQTQHMDALEQTVKANHPYECPEVISMTIDRGIPDYLKWITDSTA